MVANSQFIRLSVRAMSAAATVPLLLLTLASGVSSHSGVVARIGLDPNRHDSAETPGSAGSGIGTGSRPSAIDDPASQTRPRRVNPADPPSQASPDPGRQPSQSKQPLDPPSDGTGSAAAKRASSSGTSYTVQVGAFLQVDNARRLAKNLANKHYAAQVVPRTDSHGKKWHCVRVGSYADQDEAQKAAIGLQARLKLKAIVRPTASL